MFVMQARHVEALEAVTRAEWVQRTAHDLADAMPARRDEICSDRFMDVLRSIVEQGPRLGVRSRRGLFRLAYLSVLTRQNALDMPEMREMLSWPGQPPEVSLQQAAEAFRSSLRASVRGAAR